MKPWQLSRFESDEAEEGYYRKPKPGHGYLCTCRVCDELIVYLNPGGYIMKVSRFSVPLRDALVLGKYCHLLYIIRITSIGLEVESWFPSMGRPSRGRLYAQHVCQLKP